MTTTESRSAGPPPEHGCTLAPGLEEIHKQGLIERIFDRYNKRHLDPIADILHPDYVEHTPWGEIEGLTAIEQFVQTCLLNPFPDAKFEVFDILIEGNHAAWQVRFTGTNTVGFAPVCLPALPARHATLMQRSLMGMPPTGRSVDLVGRHRGRLTGDDRLVEHWTGHEQLAIVQQLGIPAGIARLAG